MNRKPGIKILTELLNIEDIKVISHRQHEGIGIILQVEAIKKESICPRCGTKSQRLHQNHRYIVKDLPWGEKPVYLEINKRQFKCEKCQKPFSEELDFIGERRKYTKRLSRQIIKEVLDSDINSVASKGVVTTEEIERMLKDAKSELIESKPSAVKRLGIDEIALIKGQGKYCAVLIDLDKSELLAILPSRKQEDIRKVLMEWGSQVLEQIEEVSIDLWQGYKNLVTEMMPNAQVVSQRGLGGFPHERLANPFGVADRFHVMVQINKELDIARKREKRNVENAIKSSKNEQEKVEKKKILERLNKSKYVLLKNGEDLNDEQKIKLNQVKRVSPSLKIMYELKEKIRGIFNKTKDWLKGLYKLSIWLLRARKHYPTSHNTIVRWLDEIIAYFDNRTTSGVVEGINNKLKLIKRSAYGFRNFDNFRLRCLLTWKFKY
ncbi:transposase IS204/IS1001/IS1096/IS1165 family protein [Sphaerospermopsis reniformis]|uniref:Transposase IS204/IS1001/IS1096/IS1165 family protein n=1 Tax=Sphaerospermopsis reniformis TaxID=531300 RepID=A0A480A3U5_9CYAN|nr:transposase IS204/IS1001/IS1096/IS1165 family protein [Sphaerospermopsis reniformis]